MNSLPPKVNIMLTCVFRTLVLVLLPISFIFGQSSSHDGTTSTAYAIPTNSNLEISSDITLEAWLRPNAAQTNIGNVLMKGSYGYSFGIMNDGTIAFWQTNSQNSGPESTASIAQDGTTWTHVAVVNEGGVGTTFYINGVAVGSNATGGSFQVRTGDLYIGRQGLCNCNFFNGLIDELRVWNDVRTAGEILSNYNKSVAGDEQGLAAYYRLNEGSGTTILDEVTATSYTPSVNPITWSSEDANVSDINNSLTFDANDYVDLGTGIRSDLTGTPNVTVEAWVYRTIDKTFHTIFGNYGGDLQTLLRLDGGFLTFWTNNGGGFTNATGATSIPINTWTHVAGTWDGSTIRVYVNGVEDGSSTYVGSFGSNGGNYHIGGDPSAPAGEFFQGQIDEIRVWNTTRSGSDLFTFKDEEIDPATPGLLAYYQLNEGTGTTLTDLGPNSYNGTFAAGASSPVWNTTGPTLSGASPLPCDDPIITELTTDNTSCSVPNGALTVIPSTGGGEPVGNYTVSIYLTSDVTMTPIVSGSNVDNSTGITATGLIPDIYTAEVTNNDTGCSTTQSYAVNDNTSFPTIDAGAVAVTFESTAGATDGALDATGAGQGGSGSYTYNWYADAGLMTPVASTPSISELTAGTYYLEVVDDATDCISSSESFDVLVTPNYALDFDGNDDQVNIPASADFGFGTGDFTIELWANLENESSYMHFFVHGTDQSDFAFKTRPASGDRRPYIFGASGAFNSYTSGVSDSYLPNVWNHFALVRRDGIAEFYINGSLSYTYSDIDFTNYNFSPTKTSIMGWGNSAEYTNGAYDEFRIWGVARTQSQIAAFKDVELNGTEPNLIAYYNFSDGPGSSTLTDNSTNTNNGTLFNMDPATSWIEATHTVGDAQPLDTTAPTVTITSSESGTTTLNPIPVTITFDEEVVGFELTDFVVGNGLATNLMTSDNTTFTADISPLSGGTVTVDIPSVIATDLTGNENTSATQFSIDFIAPENALDLDGTNDYIDFGNDASLNLTTSFTIEQWIYPVTDGTFSHKGHYNSPSDNSGWSARIDGTNEIRWFLEDNNEILVSTGINAVTLNQWNHVALTFDGSTAKIYVNGVEEASGTGSVGDNISYTYQIGRRDHGTPSRYFDGEVDEVRIWNVARTATEIIGNLTNVIESAPGLVSYYDFNNSGNSTLVDKVGSNNGTLIDFDFLGTSSDWVASTIPACAPNGKFIGATNSDWNDPDNWCGGMVPTSSNVTEDIVVSIDSDIVETEDLILNANDFQVAEGTSLTLDLNSNALQLTNGATFTNNGTVFFEAGTNVTDIAENFINNGTIRGFFTFDNNFTNPIQGTVAPGASPGCANFTSDFTNSGTLDIEVDGTTPCIGFDQISVGGTAFLGGTLNVTLGYTPINGDQVTIINATTISGTFAVVNLPDPDWSIAYDAPALGQVTLTYTNPTQTIGFNGPGGVGETNGLSELQLWVKADQGTSTSVDDAIVFSWLDQSGYTRTMSAGGGASPTFKSNIMNGLPVVQFAAGDTDFFEATGFTENFTSTGFTIFSVNQMTGTGDQGFIGYKSQAGLGVNEGVTFFVDDFNGDAAQLRVSSPSTGTLNSNLWSANNRVPRILSFTRSTSTLNAYDGGTNVVSDVAVGSIFNGTDPWEIGRYNNTNLKHFTGDVAEFILFEGVLNTASRTIVENYLSAKYDIAISNDLYAGDTAPNGNYDFDIAGIGNSASGSDPTATSASLTISNGAFLLDDGDYVFAGHDGTTNAVVQSDLPVGYNNRWARDWYIDIEDTGANNGLITLTFDYAQAGLTIPSSNFALITRPTGSGAYSVASTSAVVIGDKVSFDIDVASLIDGHRYTIADDSSPNNALDFDGVNDYIIVNAPSFIPNEELDDYTMEGWFYLTDNTTSQVIFQFTGDNPGSVEPGSVVSVNPSGQLSWIVRSSENATPFLDISGGNILTNQWYHVAATKNGLDYRLYLNGHEVANSVGTAIFDATNNYSDRDKFLLFAGIEISTPQPNTQPAAMDEVRIWNIARTQEQIVADAYKSLAVGSGLVASYNFDQGNSGADNAGLTTLTDITGNGNNGTLVGPFDLNGPSSNWISSTAFDSDVFSPIFLVGTPATSNFGTDNFDLTIQLNEQGLVSYVLLNDGDATPTRDEIRAGTGFLGAGTVTNGTINISAVATDFTENITGLTPGLDYDLYLVAEDNEGVPNVGTPIFINVSTLASASPGGISTSLSLWLKADEGVTGTTQVSQWDDQAGGSLNATQATAANQPALTDNAMNFNPAISFDGSNDFFTAAFDISSGTTPDLSTIIVFNSDQDLNSPIRKLFGHDAGSFQRSIGIDGRSSTNFAFFAGSGLGNAASGVGNYFDLAVNQNHISSSEYTSSTFSGYIDGRPLVNSETVSNPTGQTSLTIGAITSGGAEFWDGQIAEMIMYSGTLTTPERQRIDTYLAIKYGISIDQNVATNYVASDDGIIWNATANALFSSNITGIGRDGLSGLNQKQSVTADGVLTIGLGSIQVSNAANANTFGNDLAFLIWGDNDLDVAFAARDIANVPAGIDARIQRVWKASEANSDVGDVTLRFDLNGEGFPANFNPSNFKLILDTDADFTAGSIELTADSYAGGIVEFNSVNIANNQFFTIGLNEPPVAPSDFVVYNSSPTEITLEWTDNATNELGYQIIEADDYGFLSGINIVDNIAADATTYTHTPAANKYYIVVPTNGFENQESQSSVEFATIEEFPGQALSFDGTGQLVSIADDDALSFGDGLSDSPMTVEAWVFMDQINSRSIVSKRSGENEWHLVISSDGRVSVTLADQSTGGFLFGESPIVGFNVGEWYHVAFTYDGSSSANGINTYVDGVLQTQVPSTSGSYTAMENTNSPLEIGTINSGASFNFDGNIDELKIWNFVKPNFDDRFSLALGNESNLVAYYSFDESAGSTIVDRSTNTNDGTITGATFTPSTAATSPAEVTTTSPTGPGSIEEAINYANANPGTTISFNIPGSGPWDIVLASELPAISAQGTIIDGTTQPFWDINTANIPHIIGGSGMAVGLNFTSNMAEVYGLHVSGFDNDGIRFVVVGSTPGGYAIGAAGAGNIITNNGVNGIQVGAYTGGGAIQGNYIGILPDGTTAGLGNNTGILLGTNADFVQIGGLGAEEGNVISNNTASEIRISNADFTVIRGNNIGLDAGESASFGATTGIDLATASGVTIEENVISGHTTGIAFNNSSGNNIIRNFIGVASDGATEFPNDNGISIIDNLDSDNNIIGSPSNTGDGNIIAHNTNNGILITGAGNNGNLIQRNSIRANTLSGISLVSGAHNGVSPPGIDPIVSSTTVTGTGTTGDIIDLYYSDGSGQGMTFIGTAIVTGGAWTIGSLSLTGGDQVVATASNGTDGTSEFSAVADYVAAAYPEFEGSGNALTFDGNNDFVDVGSKLADGRTAITLEAWINPASVTPGGVADTDIRSILSEGTLEAGNTAVHLGFAGDNTETLLYAVVDAGTGFQFTTYSASNIPLNEWSHVAMTWNSGDPIRLYVNGVEVSQSGNVSGTIISVLGDFAIGRSYNTGEDYFDGQIDEVRVWDFAMPESSLREYMARKVTNSHPSFANLLAYYRMDDSGDALNLQDFNSAQNAIIDGAVYSPSGAPLGDESIYEYIYTAGSGRGFDRFKVDNLEVDNLPLHIYRVNQTPGITAVSGFDNIDQTEYYGVFSPGQTYSVEDSVNGLSPARRILRRADGTDPVWTPVSGPIGIDVDEFRMYAYGVTGSGQFTSSNDQNPYPTPADAGFAMSFDGTDNIIATNIELIGGPFTIETWFKTSQTTAYMVVVNENGSLTNTYTLLDISSGQVRFNFREPPSGGPGISLLSADTYNDDRWHHAAGIYDGVNTITLYVDGVQVDQNSSVGATSGHNVDLSLGKNFPNTVSQFIGELDEVRIWNSALSETNIRDNMIGKLDGNSDNLQNLITYYRFDENSFAIATDIAGSSDGTITGGTPVVSGAPQGQGSIYSYEATPGILKTDQFGEDINIQFEDATGGIHGYLVAGNPNQLQANGFNDLDQGKYYGVFAPNEQRVALRMDYNNGSYDPDRRIVFRDDATDNAAVGGWERLSGLINSDVTNDSIFAYNVAQGEFSTATLNPPSSYPQLGDTDPGSALDFDGSDQYVSIQDSDILSIGDGATDKAFSFEAWISLNDLTQAWKIVSKGNNLNYEYQFTSLATSGLIKFELYDASLDAFISRESTIGLTANEWYHVAAIYNGSSSENGILIYIDGVDVSGSALTANGYVASENNAESLEIGRLSGIGTFNGQIDELRIWSTALSPMDVLDFANTTDIRLHPNYEHMVAYYKFDEGIGSTRLEDIFSNNDGSLINLDENTDWVPSGALADAPEQNALNFDGTDFIDFARQNLSVGLTYEAWIRTNSTANTAVYPGNPALTVIGDNNNGIEGAFGVHGGKVRYTHWQGNATDFDQIDGTIDVNDGEWHHIAVTHKSGGNEVRIYVDGILDVVATSTIYSTGISANRVGSSFLDGTGNDNFFVGEIDEVRIWNVALPPDEIRNFLYEDDLSASPNLINLVLHYNFNQGSAGNDNSGETAVPDQTSNALDGGLAAFDLTGLNSNFVTSGTTSFTPSAPVLTASNISAFNISETTADLSWTNGDGDRRIVVVREGFGNPFPSPANGTFGDPDQYGLGTDIDNGWFVVYNGYGNSATIENLSGGTDYEVAVLELNGPPTFEAYNTNSGVDNPINFSTNTPNFNTALEFDGTAQTVSIPGFGDQIERQMLTIEAWINPTSNDAYILASELDGGIGFYVESGSLAVSDIGTSSNVSVVSTITPGVWQHVAITYNNGTLRYYVNGAFTEEVSYTLFTGSGNSNYSIGGRVATSQYSAQIIDEVRVWDNVLDDGDIATRYQSLLFGNEPNLITYYNFEDGTGSTQLTDFFGTFIGTLDGMDENTDWVTGPILNPPAVIESGLVEDFEDETLPNIASSGPFILGTGLWDGEGVLESGDIDARGGIGNGARIEPAGGNYLQTPPLDQATSLSFWFKGESTGGAYDVLASNDGITYDVNLGTIIPDPSYQEYTVDFSSNFDPSYTGAVRIAYNSGSNPLFIDDVSSDVDVLRGTVTLTTEPISDATVNAGDTDVLIYKFSAQFADADSYSEGFLLTPVGADSLDFELNGFDFYQNRVSDDLGAATLLGTGSWSPGDPIPRNSIGILFSEIYTPGETVYFYVTADITSTANPVTFNMAEPTLESFGFGNGDKLNGGLAVGPDITINVGAEPDATIATIDVPAANLVAGSTDNLVYKFSISASGGNLTKQGFGFDLGGDAVGTDFQPNGWRLFESINTDVSDPLTASDVGVTNLGDTNPGQVGFPLSGDILDGDTHYFYVLVNIDAAATNGNSFNVALDINPLESIGLADPKNKIDGGFVDGNSFTIQVGPDVTAPTVISLTPSVNPIIDIDTQFEIAIEFDENMDTGIDPTIDFPVEDPSTTLTFNSGVWDDALNYRATYDVIDVNVNLTDIDVQVTGGQDISGNTQNIYDGPDAFSVDTENPIITIDTYGTSITSPQLTGTIDDNTALINIEVAGNNYAATNNADGTWNLPAGTITPGLTDGVYDVIATATDGVGNVGTDNTTNELTISQTVVTLAAENVTSTSFTARWSEGLDVQTYQIDVSTVADFSTFLTGFQGTQTTETSIEVNDLDFSSQYYYRVRVVNTSDEVSDNSNTTIVKTVIDPETVSDSTALVQIFAAINPQGQNWETERLRNWTGVTLDNITRTRVVTVDISGTSSSGNMPNAFIGDAVGGLSNLTTMNLSNNEITGLIDFSGTAINDLNISGNRLEFDDLEPIAAASIATLDYSNQAGIQYNESLGGDQIEVRHLNDFSLSITAAGSSNQYTWYRNNVEISTSDDFIANNAVGIILGIDYDNMGTFRTEVTSTLVPGLIIDVDPQAVLAIVDVVMRLTDNSDVTLTGDTFDGALLEAIQREQGYDTLESATNVSAEFVFNDVVLGDYLCGIEPDNAAFIATYFGGAFQWDEADTVFLRKDTTLAIQMTAVPRELTEEDGEGSLEVLIEEDFGDDGGRVDARRRASKRKCGLRRKRTGGRADQDDEFELIAYGETDENGEFKFGFLPTGTYRFFVEYPGIPIDDSSFVEFEVGEAGISDKDFKLQAFANEDGVEVVIEAVLGIILEYFKDLEIYPNPSNEYLNVRYRHLKSKDVTAQLVDLYGNTKWTQDLHNGFDGEIRIDVTDFEEGIYFLRFYDRTNATDNVVTFRVVVKD